MIAFGRNHHVSPWPGDRGIRFEPLPCYEEMTAVFEGMDGINKGPHRARYTGQGQDAEN